MSTHDQLPEGHTLDECLRAGIEAEITQLTGTQIREAVASWPDTGDSNTATSKAQPIPTAGPPGGSDRQIPPADPDNPELRLLRAIFGLCPLCDRTDEHEHPDDELLSHGIVTDADDADDDPSWSDQATEDEFIDSAMDYLRHENPETPF